MSWDLHPSVVHFPIAWLPLAAAWFGLDAWRSRRRGVPVALGGADALLALATAASILSAVTGNLALSGQTLDSAATAEAAARHSRAGNWVAWLAGAALAVRVAFLAADRRRHRRRGGADRGPGGPQGVGPGRLGLLPWLALALTVLAALAAFRAGHLGGELVHEHGLRRGTGEWRPTPSEPPDRYRAR